MYVKTTLESPCAQMPRYMTKEAACADVYLPCDVTIPPLPKDFSGNPLDHIVKIPLGISFDIPNGHEIIMYPRSSLLVKQGLLAPTSIIDSDYHGIVHAPVVNVTNKAIELHAGERIAQIECRQITRCSSWPIEGSERDQNGFGGTGK